MAKGSNTSCEHCNALESSVAYRRCPIRTIDSRSCSVEPSSGCRKSYIYLEDGRFRLEREVGRGGMGTVFCAVDQSLDRVVAVKFLRPELQADPEMVEWFRQETQAAAAIVHKNVVTIYSSGRHGTSDYFIAEYIDGPSLERLIAVARAKDEQLPLSCALWMLDEACTGLSVVHAAGVVHHDVKPGNVMIEAGTGQLRIMDFGIGGMVRPDQNGPGKSSIGGTPAYMAPEAFQSSPLLGQAGRLSDIYALGVTIYETLTSVQPFGGRYWRAVKDRHFNLIPPPPSSLRSALTPDADALVLKCMTKPPSDRFQSVEDVQIALRRAFRTARGSFEEEAEAKGEVHRGGQVDGVRQKHEGRRRHSRAITADTGRKVEVVVADPDASFVTVVQEAVRSIDPRGTVSASRTVRKALELARRQIPQVIIAPLHNADISGLELLTLVESDEILYTSTRVILVTDRLTGEERRALEEKGVAAVLIAHAEPADIARALDRIVPPASARGLHRSHSPIPDTAP